MNYYNEIDPKAAAWLRALIERNLIAPGVVDERSIVDVRPADLMGFTQCHFFAGIGGWSYALRLAGWSDDEPVWTGSCPCQPFSTAGKHKGTDDERHLWPEFARLIGACRPPVVLGEQVASAAGRDWLASVRIDLEAMGYAVGAADLCAASVGAPHARQRIYWGAHRLADAREQGLERWSYLTSQQKHLSWDVPRSSGNPSQLGANRKMDGDWTNPDWLFGRDGRWRPVESETFPLAHGIPARVVRLRGYGNAIVPQVAQAFIECFRDCM